MTLDLKEHVCPQVEERLAQRLRKRDELSTCEACATLPDDSSSNELWAVFRSELALQSLQPNENGSAVVRPRQIQSDGSPPHEEQPIRVNLAA